MALGQQKTSPTHILHRLFNIAVHLLPRNAYLDPRLLAQAPWLTLVLTCSANCAVRRLIPLFSKIATSDTDTAASADMAGLEVLDGG